MPQTIVPASIAADKTKLYLDHQSKLILRTRYSASIKVCGRQVLSIFCVNERTGTKETSRKIKPTISADEKLMPDAGGTNSSPVRAMGKWKYRSQHCGHLRRMSQVTAGTTAPPIIQYSSGW